MSHEIDRRTLVYVGVILGVVFASLFGLSMIYKLKVGEVAVIVDPLRHKVSSPVIGPRWGVKLPWQHLIRDFYTIDYIEMSNKPRADYPAISALTNDGVNILIEMTFTYEVNPQKFRQLVLNYPRIDYEEQRLVPVLRQTVRDVISKYTIDQIITERDVIAKEIEETYRMRIQNDTTLGAIILHEINLRDIKLPSTVEEAIQEKIASYQKKIAAQYDAERMVTLAEGERTAKIIKAQGEANATIIMATAQKNSLEMIFNVTSNPDVAKLWMLRSLPSNTPVIVIIGNGNQPFLLDLSDMIRANWSYSNTTG